jgi:hypothetical protein
MGDTCAHRVAYKLWIADIPENLFVCHHCDSPACVNPDHLFLGTAKDNTQDMIKKGRNTQHFINRAGSNNGRAKLTDANVREIRKLYASKLFTHRELAKLFNISKTTIGSVLNQQLWQNVT